MWFKILNKTWKILKNLEKSWIYFFECNKTWIVFKINIIKHSRSWIKHEKSWRTIEISFRFLNKTEKNHEQIFFSWTKLIYTQASGHVNFWDFKLVLSKEKNLFFNITFWRYFHALNHFLTSLAVHKEEQKCSKKIVKLLGWLIK